MPDFPEGVQKISKRSFRVSNRPQLYVVHVHKQPGVSYIRADVYLGEWFVFSCYLNGIEGESYKPYSKLSGPMEIWYSRGVVYMKYGGSRSKSAGVTVLRKVQWVQPTECE